MPPRPITPPTELAEAIAQARGDETRRTLAHTIGCTEQTLYRWERGTQRPANREHIRALVELGVPLELLLADDVEAVRA